MEINGNEIYDRIVQMMDMRGIRVKDFCTNLGLTRQNLSRWKSGSLPSIDILYAIKEELKVSLDWILTGINDQDTTDPAAPYQIVNRIDNCLEQKTGHKVWEDNFNFYGSIEDIVHQQELSDWLYGRQSVDISKVVKIADRLGESVQYLITGSKISKAEYTNYFGQKETEDADFFREFSNLDKKSKDTIKHMTDLYFKEQYERK